MEECECSICGGEKVASWHGSLGLGLCGCIGDERYPCLLIGDLVVDRNFDIWNVEVGARYEAKNVVSIWRLQSLDWTKHTRYMPVWRREFTIKEKQDAQIDNNRNGVLIHEGNRGGFFSYLWEQWHSLFGSLFQLPLRKSKRKTPIGSLPK